MKKLDFCGSLLIMAQYVMTVLVLQCYVTSAKDGVYQQYFGPYKQVYPHVDMPQNQKNCSVAENGTCPLYIALMMTFGGDYVGSGAIPGIQLAIDHINSDDTILPGYTLHYTLMATRVN